MMVEKEDLGLSLSLACNYSSTAPASVDHRPRRSAFQLNLMPSLFSGSSSSSSTSLTVPNLQFYPVKNVLNPSWLDSAVPRGIDVNRLPAAAVEEEEPGVSSPNSTVSSVSGKRSEREAAIGVGGGEDLDLDEEDGDTSRKKLRLSKDQSAILEESFKEHSTLNPKQKLGLAKRLGLRPRQVEVWFQNRRARTKLKQTEVDCEYLKRCCEQLTEENRRLQKEAQELRQLKLSPQFYMQMAPPTTLTMCPSCERVDAPNRRGSPLRPWGVPAPAPVRQFEALRPAS